MRFLLAMFLATALLAIPAVAQQSSSGLQDPASEASPDRPQDPQFGQRRNRDEDIERMEKQQQKRLNTDRQKALQKDTDHLLQLATELKQYVDRTNENILSVDVIRKAEEVEKLAKNIRERMKAR